MPRGQLHERDPTLIQVLSLYLLLLAFFVILFNISKVERFKATVVADSLNSTFNDRGQTTRTPAPLTSALGRVITDPAFQRRVGQLVATEIPIAEINEIKPGSVFEARVPVNILFQNDDVAPARRPWTVSLAHVLAGAPPGLRYDVELMIGIGADDRDALRSKHDHRALSLTRAGRLAARLVASGAPSGQVAAGLERGDPSWARLIFHVRARRSGPGDDPEPRANIDGGPNE